MTVTNIAYEARAHKATVSKDLGQLCIPVENSLDNGMHRVPKVLTTSIIYRRSGGIAPVNPQSFVRLTIKEVPMPDTTKLEIIDLPLGRPASRPANPIRISDDEL